jgi:hypothetical protein
LGWAAGLIIESEGGRRSEVPTTVRLADFFAEARRARLSRHTLKQGLAGRFERLTLSHWSASSLANVFQIPPDEAASLIVQFGSYPGAMALRNDLKRWAAYVIDAIIDPAIARDVLALGTLRRPGLLRQVFATATKVPLKQWSTIWRCFKTPIWKRLWKDFRN